LPQQPYCESKTTRQTIAYKSDEQISFLPSRNIVTTLQFEGDFLTQ